MFKDRLTKCPNCEGEMELGYSIRNSPLSFVHSEKIQKFVHKDEDLNRAGLKTLLPWKASYNVAYHCPGCKILIVDYSEAVSSTNAKAAVAART
ncbi:MAG: hypothetical protein JWM16_3848 [Verrucomicrobiales bacterium]|nr:hypothetical protein [Verrucomicrobiales bacterium]